MSSSRRPIEPLALALLDAVEKQEYELLTWGFLDGGFSREELDELSQNVLDQHGDSRHPDDLTRQLVEGCLLFDFPIGDRRLYRSRFAESVRLLAHLRQIFHAGEWRVAPKLVADYRLNVRPRRYPIRNLGRAEVLGGLQQGRQLGATEIAVLDALLYGSNPAAGGLRLADFQVKAASHLLNGMQRKKPGGTIICAGTGTGKTLAFYLPCFMRVASLGSKDKFWTQAIAIYPRNELLRDQFTEAYAQARRVDGVAHQRMGRKIRIGAFFGSTPYIARSDLVARSWDDKKGGGFVCPYLVCANCGKELIWRNQDIDKGLERLVCIDGRCGAAVVEDEVSLTRNSMQRKPPDILFTTTETLNRQMNSSWTKHVFGVGLPRERSPYLMLLDEAHTYSGTHGAQVALLIRRWRWLTQAPVQLVGLSATLNDAPGFFAGLTGLPLGAVTVVNEGVELEEDGKEYQLVLRGDPVSGTSLLSTTIQTAMLLGRILDTPDNGKSRGIIGNKLFVFTDDLDVTNRLFHNLQDAEGRDSNGRENQHKVPLASFRSRGQPTLPERFRQGQAWRICEEIGHRLDPPEDRLRIGRTSSQDTGVDPNAQVIVATAALEVGYDDPSVGAVLQHKAPRDAASFIQRRGRAGRLRRTRPWTVVVLSDYGRDRLAYQAYDQLFDPTLDRLALPTANRYVLKIQMVYAFMDWMGMQLGGVARGSVWDDFTRSAQRLDGQERQSQEARIIQEMLVNGERRDDFAGFLSRALGISEGEVRALFWEPPRAFVTAVLPTLWRRLTTNWSRIQASASEPTQDYQGANTPLPDFVPQNLFSDLSVPEIVIRAPVHGSSESELWPMPLVQGLKTLAPGRVTHRFGIHHIQELHWFQPPDLNAPHQNLPVQQFCLDYEDIGYFQAMTGGGDEEPSSIDVRCIRPWTIATTEPPPEVVSTSNAFLDWRSQLYSVHAGKTYDVPSNVPLGDLFQSVTFFTHSLRCPVRVRRFALGSDASVRLKTGEERNLSIRFVDEETENQAAVGFEHEVDGVRFDCQLADEFVKSVLSSQGSKTSRTAFFLDSVENDPTFLGTANKFRLGWLGHVYLSLVLARAVRDQMSVQEAVAATRLGIAIEEVDHVLDSIFQVVDIKAGSSEDMPLDDSAERGRTHDAIRELFRNTSVVKRLARMADCLWEKPDGVFEAWLKRRLKVTMGGALLQACYQLTAQFQVGDLQLDIDSGPALAETGLASPGDAIWITEGTIGGVGIVEELLRRYSEDPRRFFMLVETALGMSDFELIDEELTRVLELSQSSREIADALLEVRQADTNHSLQGARRQLMEVLGKRGVLVTHQVMTSLNARVLRAGSSSQTDVLLNKLLLWWRSEEERLGLEIDARVFTYVACSSQSFASEIIQLLEGLGGKEEGSRLSLYAVLYAILWPRGSLIRERALESFNPFAVLPKGDPKLIRDELMRRITPISVQDAVWRRRADEDLTKNGIAYIVAPMDQRRSLQEAIFQLIAVPVESEFLRLYPSVSRIQRTTEGIGVVMHLKEAVQ